MFDAKEAKSLRAVRGFLGGFCLTMTCKHVNYWTLLCETSSPLGYSFCDDFFRRVCMMLHPMLGAFFKILLILSGHSCPHRPAIPLLLQLHPSFIFFLWLLFLCLFLCFPVLKALSLIELVLLLATSTLLFW